MKLSIVSTLYKSENTIVGFYNKIIDAVKRLDLDYEIIFINDGSPDTSLEKVLKLQEIDDKILVVDLSRNFGHHKAIMLGLSFASGDYVFLIDCDLEEEPELISQFYLTITNERELDLVYGVQDKRKGDWFEKVSGYLFYKIVNFTNQVKIPENLLTIRIMTRRYVKSLLRFEERTFSLSSLAAMNGYMSKSIAITKLDNSPTSYTFLKKIDLFVNALVSSSTSLLWAVFYCGLLITISAFSFILYLIVARLVYGITAQGWTSLIIAIVFFGGLNLTGLGIIGVYLSKVFMEVKQRPNTIVKNIYKVNSR